VRIPRISLDQFYDKRNTVFMELLKLHSFVIVTDLGEGEELYRDFMSHFRNLVEKEDSEEKSKCIGPIYANERGTPMWHVGYERASGRECWRYPVAQRNSAQHVYLKLTHWPSEEFSSSNLKLLHFMKKICDHALSQSLGDDERDFSNCEADEDFSTTFAFHYPNSKEKGYLPQEPGILVKEHIDNSLFVAEFVPDIKGLEVFDLVSNSWIFVEDFCESGKELVLFAGEGIELLEDLLPIPVKACIHRVAENPGLSRVCFIFDQKYKSYMDKGKEALRKKNQPIVQQQVEEERPLFTEDACFDIDLSSFDDGEFQLFS